MKEKEFEIAKKDFNEIKNKLHEVNTDDKQSGIYMIYIDGIELENLLPIYVGQSVNIYSRKSRHKGEIKKLFIQETDEYNKNIIQHAGKYMYCKLVSTLRNNNKTMDDIKFKVLEYCEKDKLNEREQYWINYFECFLYGFNQFNEIFETNKLIAEIYYKEQSKINYDEITKKGKKLINNFENQLRNLKKEYLIYRYYSFNISLLLGSYIDLYNILNKMSQDHFDEMNYHFDDILDETCTNINFFIAYLGKMGYIKEPKDELKVLEINK